MDTELIGIRGPVPFEDLVAHFTSLGGDVILMDPDMVCGREHVMSAVMHAERAFSNGTNRSKTILTEILLYCAWERQIAPSNMERSSATGSKFWIPVRFCFQASTM